MSNYKFVIGITGSIAAYKACDLVSKLTQEGHQVKVIMTRTAEKFIGKASLEALSKNSVLIDDFSENSLMSHIELGKWCDATMIYPCTAQSINSFASGVGHELIHSYFLAYDFVKPFFIAPAMNTRMLKHPVTQKSITLLKDMGCQVLNSESGNLACGETGAGRLIDTQSAMNQLLIQASEIKNTPKRILITAGGTRETIDGVRTLTNMSTGKTGAEIADFLHEQGHQVLLLTSRFAIQPKTDVRVDTYDSFREIHNTLRALGQSRQFDLIVHAAAISDYSIDTIQTPEGNFEPGKNKMNSQHENISIKLKRNEKILPQLKDMFRDDPTIVGFKLTSSECKQEQAKAIFGLFDSGAVDYVVHNDMNDINQGLRNYLMTSKEGQQTELASTSELANSISQIMIPKTLSGEQNDLMS